MPLDEMKFGRGNELSPPAPSVCASELLTGSSTSIAHAVVDGFATATVTGAAGMGGGAGAATDGADGGSAGRGGGGGPGGVKVAAEGLKLNVAALGLKLKDGFGNADGGGGGGVLSIALSSQLSAIE